MNLAAYLELCKPKIVLMLGLTALVGMLLSVNFYTNIFSGLISLVGFILLASCPHPYHPGQRHVLSQSIQPLGAPYRLDFPRGVHQPELCPRACAGA